MSSILTELYEIVVIKSEISSPDYQAAMAEWRRARGGSWLDLEDAAYARMYTWGEVSFSAGLRMGLELSHDLSGIWMNRS
ncbi:hypothetical protein [Intestinimonas butyriciproducens]|uniref:Uncharacterized protein n=1 Tax=Intestinimonas butyriciproducens TaxID=1297617 RepID=A0A0S2W5B9_9FIRM|nr:hypothetical protein [Intestinimonas butyriciproducens]ALP94561.1 hypothetical protein IB211_02170 [Intestinimonas butyriciproducens]MCI6362847.1 hypothetical protein [Intestinimonas butyriciproducens]MDY3616856.1 hypothetical protein [Intestinimonas butyriciproducens]